MLELFFEILRAAIWQKPLLWGDRPAPRPEEWNSLYEMAARQTVQGVMFDIVRTLPATAGLPRALIANWLLAVDGIEREYSKMNSVVEYQQRLWTGHGIDAILLKGLSVSNMYPVPEHRMTGDVDWWIPGDDNWSRALGVVHDMGCDISPDSDGDIHYIYDGIVIEHHRKGFDAEGYAGQLLMLNEHILHHAVVTGVGVRHLCDMAVAYRYFAGRYETSDYVSALKSKHLVRWTMLLHALLTEYFKIPYGYLPEISDRIKVPDSDVHGLMGQILYDGNFGFAKKRRFSGIFRKSFFYMRYAPRYYMKRAAGLLFGRIFYRL